jgi:predicted metal-binding protein
MTAYPVTLHVCLSCRVAGDDDACRAGARLHAALAGRLEGQSDILLSGVDCLSVCKRPVTVALAAPDRWTYVAADATDPDEVIAAAERYAASDDGRVPWRERPSLLKSGLVARIPPQPETHR